MIPTEQQLLTGDVSGPIEGLVQIRNLTLYAGTAPFLWNFEVYLEKEILDSLKPENDPRNVAWYITIHLAAYGTNTRVFKSSTLAIKPNEPCLIPFPLQESSDGETSDYSMNSCAAYVQQGPVIVSGIQVLMTIPHPEGAPVLKVEETCIQTNWIIGAREIVLTDPPLLESHGNKALVSN